MKRSAIHHQHFALFTKPLQLYKTPMTAIARRLGFILTTTIAINFAGCSRPPPGKLSVPAMTGPMTNASLRAALMEIKIDPPDNLRLSEKDRKAFFTIVIQICAASQVESIRDLHVPMESRVWDIMKANYPKSAALFTDPTIVTDGHVNTQILANRLIPLME